MIVSLSRCLLDPGATHQLTSDKIWNDLRGKTSLRGSTFRGIKPRRCDRTSSCMIDVLFQTYTSSMATVGICHQLDPTFIWISQLTSAIMTRRSAFAIDASTPTKSNSMVDGVSLWTDTTRSYKLA